VRDHFKFVRMRLRVVKRRDEGAKQEDNMTVRFCRLPGKYALSIISRVAMQLLRGQGVCRQKRWTCLKGKVGKPGQVRGGSGGEGRESRKLLYRSMAVPRTSISVRTKKGPWQGRQGRQGIQRVRSCGAGLMGLIMAPKGYLAGIFERITG